MDHAAFPFGEGGRAQRGRMRSSPWRTANPAGWGRSFAVARTCRFQRGRTSSPARKLRLLPLGLREPAVSNAGGLRRLLGNSGVFLWCCANLPFPTRADCVACSETLVSSLAVARTCRSHCRLLRSCSGTRFFFSFFDVLLCCAWAAAQTCAGANAAPAPAQGVSPLDPFPLARSLALVESAPLDPFSLRVPLEYAKGGSAAFAAEPPQSFIQ